VDKGTRSTQAFREQTWNGNVKVEVDNGAEISSLRDWLLLCFHEKAIEYLFSNMDFQKRTKYMIPTTIGISVET